MYIYYTSGRNVLLLMCLRCWFGVAKHKCTQCWRLQLVSKFNCPCWCCFQTTLWSVWAFVMICLECFETVPWTMTAWVWCVSFCLYCECRRDHFLSVSCTVHSAQGYHRERTANCLVPNLVMFIIYLHTLVDFTATFSYINICGLMATEFLNELVVDRAAGVCTCPLTQCFVCVCVCV